MGVWSACGSQSATLKTAVIIEESKTVTRDLQGSDPERMKMSDFFKKKIPTYLLVPFLVLI